LLAVSVGWSYYQAAPVVSNLISRSEGGHHQFFNGFF
jgi:hypothetical protein